MVKGVIQKNINPLAAPRAPPEWRVDQAHDPLILCLGWTKPNVCNDCTSTFSSVDLVHLYPEAARSHDDDAQLCVGIFLLIDNPMLGTCARKLN